MFLKIQEKNFVKTQKLSKKDKKKKLEILSSARKNPDFNGFNPNLKEFRQESFSISVSVVESRRIDGKVKKNFLGRLGTLSLISANRESVIMQDVIYSEKFRLIDKISADGRRRLNRFWENAQNNLQAIFDEQKLSDEKKKTLTDKFISQMKKRLPHPNQSDEEIKKFILDKIA